MKSTYKLLLIFSLALFVFVSCENEYGPRKESTPVIESAAINPTAFTFGDSVTLNAKITDSGTRLTTLSYQVVSQEKVITSGEIPLNGSESEVSQAIFIPLLKNQADKADVQVNLVVHNVLKGSVESAISGLTGNRPVYNKLYLVTDDGAVAELSPQSDNKDRFAGQNLTLDPFFRFKIAEKLYPDNTIDYNGDVYGYTDGKLAMISENGESAFSYSPDADYTKEFTFDNLVFSITASGSKLGADDFSLSTFGDTDIMGETFRILKRTLENGKTYSLFGRLADAQNIYNLDFFERTAPDKVKFLGETGEYTLYFNPVRKNVIVGLENPSYPNYLLACGWGLGYPTPVSSADIASVYPGHQRTHSNWGFNDVMTYVLLRRIADGVFQGTFYTPSDGDHFAGFKPFENTGWANEKRAGDFTFTGEKIISGANDWTIPNGEDDPVIESTNYRFTIDLNNKNVHIEKINL